MDDARSEKAASRAAWNRHQRFLRQKKRGHGGKRGVEPHGPRIVSAGSTDSVRLQNRRYEEDIDGGDDLGGVGSGEDYEEWLSSCPREIPMLLQRQRHALPDVGFLLRSPKPETRVSSPFKVLKQASRGSFSEEPRDDGDDKTNDEETGRVQELDLCVLRDQLSKLPEHIRLDIPPEVQHIVYGKWMTRDYDVMCRDPFARHGALLGVSGMNRDVCTSHQNSDSGLKEVPSKAQECDNQKHIGTFEQKTKQHVTPDIEGTKRGVSLEEDLDALLNLGDVAEGAPMFGGEEREDLDAWFDAL